MAVIRQVLSLQDRMSPVLNRVQQQAMRNMQAYQSLNTQINSIQQSMRDMAARGQQNTVMYRQLQSSVTSLTQAMNGYANGTRNAQQANASFSSGLPSMITGLASIAGLTAGASKLASMSDTYSATRARIDMMTESFQDANGVMEMTNEIQNKIFNSAQRAGVSYNMLSDTVAKLGNQAGNAFGSSSEVIAFSELINKSFQTAGLDATQIESTMYNLTQSLSTGKLLGQDYRIIKQNAPQIIKYLEKVYGVSRAELDKMVSDGQVTAEALKTAMFNSADEINEKYSKMPMSFSAAWTKFMNTLQKMSEPLMQILTKVAQGLDTIFTFLAEHQYILYIVAGAIAAIVGAIVIYNVVTAIAAAVTAVLELTLGGILIIIVLIIVVIMAYVAALLYLWNTNDEFAEAVLFIWDSLRIGMMMVALGIKKAWFGLQTGIEVICAGILTIIQAMINTAIKGVNLLVDALNIIPGVNINKLEEKTFADDYAKKVAGNAAQRAAELDSDWENIQTKAVEYNSTRSDRVANRTKVGLNLFNKTEEADYKSMAGNINNLAGAVGNDSAGGKAIKTTSTDDLLSDEDIQLLLDVATRDYKLNYQQVTPNITLTFGDVRETADVDNILDEVASRLEEIYDSSLEVSAVGS